MVILNVDVLVLIAEQFVNLVNFETNFMFKRLNVVSKFFIQENNPCSSNPCLNGGVCNFNRGTCSFTCTCSRDYTGTLCGTRTNFKNHRYKTK
jgi:hypothetical protein